MDAAESIRAVSFMFVGLLQPEDIVLISLNMKLASMILFSSAGPHHQAPFGAFPCQEFHVLPPVGFRRVASLLWSSFFWCKLHWCGCVLVCTRGTSSNCWGRNDHDQHCHRYHQLIVVQVLT